MASYELLKIILLVVVAFSNQFLALANNCVHGRWEGDVCVCDSGYETVVNSDTTEPSYCTEQTIVVIVLKGEKTWTHRDVIDLAFPIITVYILGVSVIATVVTLYKAIGLCWSKENLRKLINEDAKFSDMERRYKNATIKDAIIWELPFEQYNIVNSAKDAEQDMTYKHAKVLYDYKARDDEELTIREGDFIMDVIELENGWWQGNLNGAIGYFPGEYVELVENKNKSDKGGIAPDVSLISETSSFYLKQRFGIDDAWNKNNKKKKGKIETTGDQPESDPIFEEEQDTPDDTRPKKKTKKHGRKKYTEIDHDEEVDVKKERREHRKEHKYDKEQTSPKHDEGEPKKHRKARKKHTKSHSNEQQIVQSETELLSSAMSIEKERKKKRTHKESSERRTKREKKYEPLSDDDEQFLEGADSPLMSLTDVSSEDDKLHKSPKKGVFHKLFT